MTPDPYIQLRLAAWYAPAIGALAVAPYWSVILADRGLSDPQIALFLAVLPTSTLFAGPLWGWLADRSGQARTLLFCLVAGASMAVLLPLGATGWLAGIGVATFGFLRSPQAPMVDALAVRVLPRGGRDYGPVRLWGSIAFLVVAVANGRLRDDWPNAPMIAASVLLGLAALSTLALPPMPPAARPRLGALLRAVRGWEAAVLLASFVLHGIGLAYYNAFYSRHVESLGHSGTVTGASLGVAVAVEIVVMQLAPRMMGRVSPVTLVVVGMMLSVPRWLGTAYVTNAYGLVALQALHGGSFGLFWVAAVPAIASRADASVARSVQALLPASAFGLGPLFALGLASLLLQTHPTSSLFVVATGASIGASILGATLLGRTHTVTATT